jgi:hypothetical protein
MLYLIGEADPTVPSSPSRDEYEIMEASGVDITLMTYPGGVHVLDGIDFWVVAAAWLDGGPGTLTAALRRGRPGSTVQPTPAPALADMGSVRLLGARAFRPSPSTTLVARERVLSLGVQHRTDAF